MSSEEETLTTIELGDSHTIVQYKNTGYNCYILTHEKSDLWTCGMYDMWFKERVANDNYVKVNYSYRYDRRGLIEIGFYYNTLDLQGAKQIIALYSSLLHKEDRLVSYDLLKVPTHYEG
uniref:Uncharacterized protein n=1 Tax=Clandestinovirus TaxID=2831644 RepID=A0A8F8KTM6_9VIRU|nr:hypothetical protein KOM_12_557 [Clandestinovirus]